MIKNKVKDLVEIISKPDLEILPGHLAFSLVLSIVPIITILVLFASFFSVSVDLLITFMQQSFPTEVSKALVPLIDGSGFDINIIIFIIVGFAIASNGLYSVIVTSNILYQVDSSNIIKRRIKALVLTLLIVLLFIFILIVLAFGNIIAKLILSLITTGLSKTIYFIFVLLKWPISFIIIFFSINLIYAITPDKNISSKYTKKGAFFTTVAWMLATLIYSYYAANIANYDIFYGSLSSVMVMMIWAYMLSYIFVLGIAINVKAYKLEKSTTDK